MNSDEVSVRKEGTEGALLSLEPTSKLSLASGTSSVVQLVMVHSSHQIDTSSPRGVDGQAMDGMILEPITQGTCTGTNAQKCTNKQSSKRYVRLFSQSTLRID